MTELQQALLDYVHAFLEARDDSPQTSDVVRHFRSRREGDVTRALEGMASAGHLILKNGRWSPNAPVLQLHLLPVEDTGPRPR
jgi:hypothetical protein